MKIIKTILRPFWRAIKFCLLKIGFSPEKISDGKIAVLDFLASLLPVGVLRHSVSGRTIERAYSLPGRKQAFLKMLNEEWDARNENRD
ncbi:MAG: hypothetical protein IJS14_14240 [Lentisphaeria bacterium]|nr:hypothetical protein [Lentisphaeria bacterium]